MIFNELVRVISTKKIAQNTYQTFLNSSSISSVIKPGQFINILPSNNWDKMMRRPMSVASQKEGEISIIYKVVGDGTQFMKNWVKGDVVDIIGPLEITGKILKISSYSHWWDRNRTYFKFYGLLNQQNIKHAL